MMTAWNFFTIAAPGVEEITVVKVERVKKMA